MQQHILGTNWLENSFAEDDLEILVETKMTMSQQGTLVAKKATSLLDHTRHSMLSKWRGDPVLYSPLVGAELECCAQLQAPQYKRDRDIMEISTVKGHKGG